MKTRKRGLGHKWCVYHRKKLSCSSQLQEGFSWSLGHLLTGQHMLGKMTRSQRNFIKIINGLEAEGRMKNRICIV